MEFKLYRCAHCGNIAYKLVDKGTPLFCCGQKMDEVIPNTTDGAHEKHVPVVERAADGAVKIKVGSVQHPMLPEHYIPVIAAVGSNTVTIKYPQPGEVPELDTCTKDAKIDAYELCNLHGFWKGEG